MRKKAFVKAGLAAVGIYGVLGASTLLQNWIQNGGEKLNFEERETALRESRYYGTALLSAGDPLQPVNWHVWEGFTYEQDEKGRFYLINRTRPKNTGINLFLSATKPARLLAYKITDNQ